MPCAVTHGDDHNQTPCCRQSKDKTPLSFPTQDSSHAFVVDAFCFAPADQSAEVYLTRFAFGTFIRL